MNIFIDESGNFIAPGDAGIVSVVAGLVVPEKAKRAVNSQVFDLVGADEKKANAIDESALANFFAELAKKKCLGVGVAMMLHPRSTSTAEAHKIKQAEKLLAPRGYMEHEKGKRMMGELHDKVKSLPDQLYAQLIAQLLLIWQVIHNSSMFYAKHDPVALRNFRWRIDAKNNERTKYERAFQDLAPGILQTMSFDRPLVTLTDAEFNYEHMVEFENSVENFPEHLVTHANRTPTDTYNIGRMIWDNFRFEDSKKLPGIQAADLLATCTRRCIQGKFDDPESMARHLGQIFHRHPLRENCIELISLQDSNEFIDQKAADAIRTMNAHSTNIC